MPQFDLRKFCSTIENENITYFHIVPRIISALAKDPIVDSYDLKSVKMIVSAASPLSPDLIRAVYKKHGIPVCQALGMSETSPATHHQVRIFRTSSVSTLHMKTDTSSSIGMRGMRVLALLVRLFPM